MSNEYGQLKGNVCYYVQNDIGSDWVSKADNDRGWTVDFNLRVLGVQGRDSFYNSVSNEKYGAGVYVDDGKRKEIVNFFEQEIVFSNAKKSIIYNTTEENEYRLIGKGDSIRLFSKPYGSVNYSEIVSAGFLKESSFYGNSLNPDVFEDINGNIHAVWWDDAKGIGSIYYSFYNKDVWTSPVLISVSDYSCQFPSVIVNENGIIYVSFDCKIGDKSVIALVYNDSNGWSLPYYNDIDGDGFCNNSKMTFDSQSNVYLVFEKELNNISNVYINTFYFNDLKWGEQKNISEYYKDDEDYFYDGSQVDTGVKYKSSRNPEISSYGDNIFVSWTQINENNKKAIKVARYNAVSGFLDNSIAFYNSSNDNGDFDNSDILCNVSGKVYIVWENFENNERDIYYAILNPSLDILVNSSILSMGNGNCRYPSLSEQLSTGYVYVVWQDVKNSGDTNNYIEERQNSSSIYSAVIKDTVIEASGGDSGSFDVKMSFSDDRNCHFPSTPVFFSGELPIIYESSAIAVSNSIDYKDFNYNVNLLYYPLYRDGDVYIVTNEDSSQVFDRDHLINAVSKKEIRFGDFSNYVNVHFIFKSFKYYLSDAVVPLKITEINSDKFNVSSISSVDAAINNYGDAWIIGQCGIFYYLSKYNNIVQVGPDGIIPGLKGVRSSNSTSISDNDYQSVINSVSNEYSTLKDFKAVSFDKNNNIYIGGDNGLLRYSTNHFYGFKNANLPGIDSSYIITSIVFDKDNRMFIGTNKGLFLYDNVVVNNTTNNSDVGEISFSSSSNYVYSNFKEFDYYPDTYITSLKIDSNNCLWICTNGKGLFRFYKDKFINFTVKHGMLSNVINDIAVRNTAIRYVATSAGINKMVGFNFDALSFSEDNYLWNANVKSISWKDPNVIFAGTLSKINQILVDDDSNSYLSYFYSPSFNAFDDDFSIYYISDDNISILENDIFEVYINGQKINDGYSISYINKSIKFKTNLKNTDIVEVVVRRDIKEAGCFYVNRDNVNSDKIRISGIDVRDDGSKNVFISTYGYENEIKINDSVSNVPFDKVHIDTTPPNILDESLGIKIDEQVDGSIVRVSISGASDDIYTSDGEIEIEGSGIEKMVVSNFSNFTTDGSTPQIPVPYSTSFTHDLGISLDNVTSEIVFETGVGSRITYVNGKNYLYACTSSPAVVYLYNWLSTEWEEVLSYGNDNFIDFIVENNNKLIVSVGHNISSAVIYVYEYVDGVLSLFYSMPISESRAYCFHSLNGKLYIGSGTGAGDGSMVGLGSSGAVYVFEDSSLQGGTVTLTRLIDIGDENVYSISNSGNNLILSTGPSGFLYEVDIDNVSSFIIYKGDESLTSVYNYKIVNDNFIFVGGESNGIIRKAKVGNNSYDISFRTLSSKINNIKEGRVSVKGNTASNYDSIYASAGNVLYYLSNNGTWTWKYTHNEEIFDFVFYGENNEDNIIYVISSEGVTKVNPNLINKTIYLKLIDRAGNETGTIGEISDIAKEPFADSVSISSLKNFVNENKIFEVDVNGNVSNILNDNGKGKFYSANKIEEEFGEYVSEIFDGTSELVKWDIISWTAVELVDTTVTLYLRSSSSSTGILDENWNGPFYNYQSGGINISYLSGKFIQFKTILSSKVAGVSPSLYSVTIRAVTSEAVHFFTTNFTVPSKVNKGILTSQKIVPVSADIVFGINTTNSVDWNDYQIIDENRIFNVNQIGTNIRVGAKLISPNRDLVSTVSDGDYSFSHGEENTSGGETYVNTISFDILNDTGQNNYYHLRVSLYDDVYLSNQVFSIYSLENATGFSVDEVSISSSGIEVANGDSVSVLFSVPNYANLQCNTNYFVKVEYVYDDEFVTLINDGIFYIECSSSFINDIYFDFTNNSGLSSYYNFRIKFYEDPERTIISKTVLSSNVSGWLVDGAEVPEDGVLMNQSDTVSVSYTPDTDDFDIGTIYYMTIEAHDGEDYVFKMNSYTFQVRDIISTESCGLYSDVPIIKNFAIMFELDNNEFVTLNI